MIMMIIIIVIMITVIMITVIVILITTVIMEILEINSDKNYNNNKCVNGNKKIIAIMIITTITSSCTREVNIV